MVEGLIAALAIAPAVETAFNGMGGLDPFPEKRADLAELATLTPSSSGITATTGASVRFDKIITGSPSLAMNDASSVGEEGLIGDTGRMVEAVKNNVLKNTVSQASGEGSRTSMVQQSLQTSNETSRHTGEVADKSSSAPQTKSESEIQAENKTLDVLADASTAAAEDRTQSLGESNETRSSQGFRIYEAAQKLERDIAFTHEKMFNLMKVSV